MVALKMAKDNIIVCANSLLKYTAAKLGELQSSLGAGASSELLLTWQSRRPKSPGLPARHDVASRQENWLKMILLHLLTKIYLKIKEQNDAKYFCFEQPAFVTMSCHIT